MNLLEAFKSNGLSLKNRIVMAPLTRSRANNDALIPTDLHVEYYQQRASAGLIISEGVPVSQRATGYINVPGIYSNEQVEAWKKVTTAVHEKEGKIFAQLWHVGRISHPDLLNGELPLAPSAINPNFHAFTKNGFADTVQPKAMTEDEIDQTIEDFAQAALNAVEAGFDGVEIHAANGYLFHQFFAKCSNVREDKYGGSIENRARFLFDVLNKIISKMPANKVGIRLAPALTNTFGIVIDEETKPLFEYIVNELNDYDLAYLHISGFSQDVSNSEKDILDTAKHYRNIYKGTFMINGGFTKESGNEAIENKIADLVSYGRLYISNPDLVERFANNYSLNEINRETIYTPGAVGYTDYPLFS